jgi:hypothetical protein
MLHETSISKDKEKGLKSNLPLKNHWMKDRISKEAIKRREIMFLALQIISGIVSIKANVPPTIKCD